jgi:competence ComEA-like helix-hairpin-helix protein
MLAEEPEESAIPVEAPPEEKLDLNVASLAQLEKIPGIGFIHAQNIIDYRASHGSFTDFEQLQEVEGFSADMLPDLETYLSVEVVKEVPGVASDVPELQNAWNNVSQGNIQDAVNQYTALINQDQHLDETIRDLHSALGKYPNDSSLYQTLGDAYMRSNMLQEALDAYNRAEDLLQ